MSSLPSDNQTYSSTIVEVAQVTQPNPTMERSTKDVIIPSAHSSDAWISLQQDSYKSFASLQPQPPAHSHNTNHVLHLLSDTQIQHSNLRYTSSTPVWRVYHPMATKGLCSKRVEDVKMNRIDKHKSGRRRRPCRRPFVFKSSPLAEGQGAGRFTHFRANTFPQTSTSQLSPPTHQSATGVQPTFRNSQGSSHISRFLDPRDSAIQQWLGHSPLDTPVSFSTFNYNGNTFTSSHKQPQISRLRNSELSLLKSTPSQSKTHYQSWEISLPKCSLPKIAMFSS